jgi:hypothetical protein
MFVIKESIGKIQYIFTIISTRLQFAYENKFRRLLFTSLKISTWKYHKKAGKVSSISELYFEFYVPIE